MLYLRLNFMFSCRYHHCGFKHTGFYFMPGALSLEEQCQWIRESLMSFPQPPNRTNHNAMYGPIHDLFKAAMEKKILVEDLGLAASLDCRSNSRIANGNTNKWKFYEEQFLQSRGKTCKSISASVLLRKLRWSTLGLQFDWSKVISHHPFFWILICLLFE